MYSDPYKSSMCFIGYSSQSVESFRHDCTIRKFIVATKCKQCDAKFLWHFNCHGWGWNRSQHRNTCYVAFVDDLIRNSATHEEIWLIQLGLSEWRTDYFICCIVSANIFCYRVALHPSWMLQRHEILRTDERYPDRHSFCQITPESVWHPMFPYNKFRSLRTFIEFRFPADATEETDIILLLLLMPSPNLPLESGHRSRWYTLHRFFHG